MDNTPGGDIAPIPQESEENVSGPDTELANIFGQEMASKIPDELKSAILEKVSNKSG
jgi:hypothetical protein